MPFWSSYSRLRRAWRCVLKFILILWLKIHCACGADRHRRRSALPLMNTNRRILMLIRFIGSQETFGFNEWLVKEWQKKAKSIKMAKRACESKPEEGNFLLAGNFADDAAENTPNSCSPNEMGEKKGNYYQFCLISHLSQFQAINLN